MAETLYNPSSSGYTSDSFASWEGALDSEIGKNSWSISTSTAIQGDNNQLINGNYYMNYYGIIYFDFAAIRAMNVNYYPAKIRILLHSHTGAVKTIHIHMGKGMAKDSYYSTDRPVDATGTAYKSVQCAANSWCELDVTDPAWLTALVDANTTCFYININPSGSNPYGEGYAIFFGLDRRDGFERVRDRLPHPAAGSVVACTQPADPL